MIIPPRSDHQRRIGVGAARADFVNPAAHALAHQIEEDRVPNGNSWLPAVLISYKDEAGDIQALPLANANADLAPLRSMPEVRSIASELSRLRTGAAEGSA
jgi:hypothetical protein